VESTRVTLGNQRPTTTRRETHLLSGHAQTDPNNRLASDDQWSDLSYL
jgi:hypothetical protein